MLQTAKLFRNGRSQAVRLPAAFRFNGSEVVIERDPLTGNVVLSPKPGSWAAFFQMAQQVEVPEDFPCRDTSPPQERDGL
jgi:antitoxin VapB